MANEKPDPAVDAYWQSFLASLNKLDGPPPTSYQAWGFGNTPEMADELGKLVQEGTKTATASLAWWYDQTDEPIPQVGDYSVILDGSGQPMCVIQTTQVSIHPFNEVSEDQAYLEGEGDRSLRYWREVHWQFFTKECKEVGREPHEQMPVVCEKFRLVYT